MIRDRLGRFVLIGAALFSSAGIAKAGTVNGTVVNGTTSKPAAGIDLTLIQLQGGMQEVAHAKSGAQGQFTFDHPGLGMQPMLVRASYGGVNFNTAVPPGASSAQVDIYEASKDPKSINVPSHVVVLQPNGTSLLVGEEYQVENKTTPPVAFYRTDGSFNFAIPEKGELQNVSAAGSTGMPVTQLPMDKKKNHYAIAYAFRPGNTLIRLSYTFPYSDSAATIKVPTTYPGSRLLVAAPPGIQVSGEGLTASGQEQGMNIFLRDDVPAGNVVAVRLSGTAVAQAAGAGQDQQGQQGRDAQGGGNGTSGVQIVAVPGRLDGLKWYVIGGFVVVFAMLSFMLSRKPVPAMAGAAPEVEIPAPKRGKPVAASPTPPQAAPAAVSVSQPAPMADVDRAVGTSLDELKERLFRLELRRQAGTISEEEYAQERGRAEKVLRDLLRG